MKLSAIVSSYRAEHNMSQREFAKLCGLSNSYISFIEREINPNTGNPIVPAIEQYKKIANAMGMSLQALFEKLDSDSPVSLSSQLGDLSPDEYHLLSLYRGADDRAKEDAVRVLADHQKKDTHIARMG